VLFLAPTVASLFFSLTRWNFQSATFIGLDNFRQFFHEQNLYQGLINTLIYGVLTSGLKVVLGLLLGMLLTSQIVARGYLRAVVFFPVLVSTVGVGITWKTGRVPLSGCRLTSVDEGEYVAGNRAILDTLPLFPGATRLRAPNRMTVRRRGAMRECDARTQGAPICGHIGATEDEAVCRAARSGVTSLHSVRSS